MASKSLKRSRRPGQQGAAAIGRPLRAPCTIQFIWRGTLRERNPLLKPNKTAAG
ncbi:hypothetical protein ECDEC11A_1076 [Escherichia coli DEC11A]|nr:hypothetical protein ECDEC11A_1076 [Escherichia coli DEC11A]